MAYHNDGVSEGMLRIFGFYYFVYFVALAASSPFLSLYLQNKGMSATDIGVLFAVGSVAAVLAQPILGMLNDRASDPRRILLLSAILTPVFYSGYAILHGYWPLLIVAALVAVASSTNSIMDAVTITAGQARGFSYGQVRLWGALGFALTAMFSGYVYHVTGIGSSFYVFGALSLVSFGAILALPKTGHVDQGPREPFFRSIFAVAGHPLLSVFILICFLLSITNSVNYSFLPLYYKDLHHPMALVGLNFSVAAFIEVPFFWVSGKLARRFGLMRVIITGTLLYAIKFALMALAPSTLWVISLQVLDGIGYALVWSASVEMVNRLAPANRGATAQTLYGAIAGTLSGIVGSAGGGFVLDRFGPLTMYGVIAILAFTAAVGFLVFHLSMRSRGHSLAHLHNSRIHETEHLGG